MALPGGVGLRSVGGEDRGGEGGGGQRRPSPARRPPPPPFPARAGIPGCVFVHASGFIGGHATFEGALEMARKALAMQ